MKKKIALLLLTAALSLSLTACGKTKEAADKTAETTPAASTEENKDNSAEVKKNETKSEEKASTSTDGKTSTASSPLKFGETGTASKITSDGTSTANVSIDKITRGEEAQKFVDKYNSEDHGVILSPIESSTLEYAVVDYTLTIPESFPHDELSPDGDITTDIVGADGDGLIYDGILYSVSTWTISDTFDEVVKPGKPYKGQIAFQIPKGCTDYLIQVGEYDDTQSFFKGE